MSITFPKLHARQGPSAVSHRTAFRNAASSHARAGGACTGRQETNTSTRLDMSSCSFFQSVGVPPPPPEVACRKSFTHVCTCSFVMPGIVPPPSMRLLVLVLAREKKLEGSFLPCHARANWNAPSTHAEGAAPWVLHRMRGGNRCRCVDLVVGVHEHTGRALHAPVSMCRAPRGCNESRYRRCWLSKAKRTPKRQPSHSRTLPQNVCMPLRFDAARACKMRSRARRTTCVERVTL